MRLMVLNLICVNYDAPRLRADLDVGCGSPEHAEWVGTSWVTPLLPWRQRLAGVWGSAAAQF